MNKVQQQQDWAEAVRMAKELGFSPTSLIKHIPSPQQPWKAPVEEWVRERYAKRERKRLQKSRRQAKAAARQAARAAGTPGRGDGRDVRPVDAALSRA